MHQPHNKFNFHMLLALVNSSDLQIMTRSDDIRIYNLHFCRFKQSLSSHGAVLALGRIQESVDADNLVNPQIVRKENTLKTYVPEISMDLSVDELHPLEGHV